MDRLLTGVY
jgi:hypothetical protein